MLTAIEVGIHYETSLRLILLLKSAKGNGEMVEKVLSLNYNCEYLNYMYLGSLPGECLNALSSRIPSSFLRQGSSSSTTIVIFFFEDVFSTFFSIFFKQSRALQY